MAEPMDIEIPVEEGKSVIKLTQLPKDWKTVIRVLERELTVSKSVEEIRKYYQVRFIITWKGMLH